MKEQNSHNENPYLAKWLGGEISNEELKKIVSETDFKAFLKLKKGIEVYEKFESPLEESLKKINSKIHSKKPSYNYRALSIAASFIILFGLLALFNNNSVAITTDYGTQKTVTLVDGSEVILNSKSEITYNEKNWNTDRTLFLDGEAYFKVKKGSKFTVETTNGSIEVLGTQFNVNSKNEYFQVVCYEGKVGVKNSDGYNVLLPNQHIRKINGNDVEKWDAFKVQPGWVMGESSFKSVPIKYVIEALENQYNIQFKTNNIDQSLIYTGSFTHSNLNTALRTVFKTLGIRYLEKEPRVIELSLN